MVTFSALSSVRILWRACVAVQRFMYRRGGELAPSRDTISSLLLIELTRLGDVIEMIPALRLFIQSHPSATVHLMVDGSYASFLEVMGLGISVHGIRRSNSAAGFLRAVREARRLRPRLSVSMSPAKRNSLVCVFSRAPSKVGYLIFDEAHGQYVRPIPVDAIGYPLVSKEAFGKEHIANRSLKICDAMGIGRARHGASSRRYGERARPKVPSRTGIVPSSPYVVIHPFAGWSFRVWPPERFSAVAEFIRTSLELDVVFIGSGKEAYDLEKFRKHFDGDQRVHCVASSDLTDTCVLLQHAALFVGNDSGPLHLAALLGVPSVGLFGPASPALTGPVSARNIYLYHTVECSPCGQTRCIRAHEPCIALITTDEIISAVTRLLDDGVHDGVPAHE